MNENIKLEEGEILVDIKGAEGYFKVSNLGRIFRVRFLPDCTCKILHSVKTSSTKDSPDPKVIVTAGGLKHSSVLASTIFDNFYPEKSGLRYKFKDGNRLNVRLDNIEACPSGLPRRGLKEMIREELKKDPDIKALAEKLGCSEERIRQIKRM